MSLNQDPVACKVFSLHMKDAVSGALSSLKNGILKKENSAEVCADFAWYYCVLDLASDMCFLSSHVHLFNKASLYNEWMLQAHVLSGQNPVWFLLLHQLSLSAVLCYCPLNLDPCQVLVGVAVEGQPDRKAGKVKGLLLSHETYQTTCTAGPVDIRSPGECSVPIMMRQTGYLVIPEI